MTLQGPLRRFIYVAMYEAIAIAICSVYFLVLAETSVAVASGLSVACSVIAMVWNVVFNSAFEAWEARHPCGGRPLHRRVAHALLFEVGLIIVLVPLIAWWLELGLIYAFVANLGMAAFFMTYTFVFQWGFDLVFGLPASAKAA